MFNLQVQHAQPPALTARCADLALHRATPVRAPLLLPTPIPLLPPPARTCCSSWLTRLQKR